MMENSKVLENSSLIGNCEDKLEISKAEERDKDSDVIVEDNEIPELAMEVEENEGSVGREYIVERYDVSDDTDCDGIPISMDEHDIIDFSKDDVDESGYVVGDNKDQDNVQVELMKPGEREPYEKVIKEDDLNKISDLDVSETSELDSSTEKDNTEVGCGKDNKLNLDNVDDKYPANDSDSSVDCEDKKNISLSYVSEKREDKTKIKTKAGKDNTNDVKMNEFENERKLQKYEVYEGCEKREDKCLPCKDENNAKSKKICREGNSEIFKEEIIVKADTSKNSSIETTSVLLGNKMERSVIISDNFGNEKSENNQKCMKEKAEMPKLVDKEKHDTSDEDDIFVLSEKTEKNVVEKDKLGSKNKKMEKESVKSKSKKEASEVICLDSKPIGEILIRDDVNRKPRKQCCNLECESRDILIKAPVAILTYYGLKYVKGKSQRVCKTCFENAVSHQERLAYVLMEHKSLLKEIFPVRKDIALIDDSDEENSDEEPPLGEDILREVDDKLMEVIDSSLENYDLDYQIKEADAILQETYHSLRDEFEKTDEAFNELQREVDELRLKLYRGFAPKIKELPSLEIMDTPEFSQSPEKVFRLQGTLMSPTKRMQVYTSPESPRRSPLAGVATKKVTHVTHRTGFVVQQVEVLSQAQQGSAIQQEVVALEQIQQVQPVLPPVGSLCRPRPCVHDVLFVMRNGYYGVWARAKLLEVMPKVEGPIPNKMESQYKIKFESRKSSMVKTVTGKQIAYSQPCPIRLPVGTRVIALFRDEWAKECYYAGIIAEPPKSMNKYRYLVFFDDGYAQYVCHEKILLVCESSRNVWEDIHPDSQDFVRNYLEQYPERPMLKLQCGQIVKTEWNGKWWIARVLEVDGSLVKMHFDADGRTELIYRGSTRLGPLYSELANAAARKSLGSFSRHRTMGISSLKRRNMPYVEYTRSDLDENKLEESGEINRSLERSMPSRAVAKKSTSKRTDSAREQLEALILSSDSDIQSGHVETIYINPSYKPKMFMPHQCGHRCIEGIPYDASQIKHYNPLVLPLLHGWQRHITRCKGKKIVIYRSPCGRRLRNMEELHRYLRVTKSSLSVDLFDYDCWVHCFSEFLMRTGFINIKDLSYGHEHVPVPCVNNVDHSKPEYVKYSTVRLPMEGVNVNTDPQFLVCCDCMDDCQNKEKCACWQLTIQGTAYASGGKVDTSVGYWYKRLREPVTTGIYECNSRCKCASTCLNRVAQHPLQLRLQVFKTENRGWGIRCLNDVPHGAFICIYAGRLLTEQGANEGGKNYGDEYLAELDYIEVVERLKEGYESDVVEDEEEAPFSINKEEKAKKGAMSEEDEEEGENSHDAHDSDFELDSKHQHIHVLPLEESTIRTRLRNRKGRYSSIDSEGRDKEGGRDENTITEKAIKKTEGERKGSSDDASSLITLSDDEDEEQREREPSRFAAMSDPKKETEKKVSYKSVREFFGDDEFCYIMDAKNDGNIGRYLNHSCSPNVFVQNVFVDTHDLRFPWVAFFALTYISAGTELTWDYNYDVGSVPGKVLHCYCGSSDCRGRLL